MELTLTLDRPDQRLGLFGPGDRYLKLVRDSLDVQLFARDGKVKIAGAADNVARAAAVLQQLQRQQKLTPHLSETDVVDALTSAAGPRQPLPEGAVDVLSQGQIIKPKTPGQTRYLEAMRVSDLVFCIGPAGTGKTYLAVAVAVHMLKHRAGQAADPGPPGRGGRARSWASCPATCRPRSTPTCARCSTPCTT